MLELEVQDNDLDADEDDPATWGAICI